MAECRIPVHITGLYVFAVVNLCAMLNISLVSAHVSVIDVEQNTTLHVYKDSQALFGPDFPDDGIVGRVVYVLPNHDACHEVHPPPNEIIGVSWIALISRGPCHFDLKVLNAQKAGYSAAIVHNFAHDDNVMAMGSDSQYADKVHIPSVFVGWSDGMALAYTYNYTDKSVVIQIKEPPQDTPATFFLPFLVVVSICFVGVVAFSIIKCVKYFQHIRRTRLSMSALKRIPTRKYKKGDHYDTCAICLEDYEEGEKLRVLPCNHTYHCKCIDPWLTKRKKTCPQCKRRVIPGQDTDSDTDEDEGGASETTPLLANNNNRRSEPSTRRGPQPSTSQGTAEPVQEGGEYRARASTFDRSGLPAVVQPEVVVINEGQSTLSTAQVAATQPGAHHSHGEEEEEGEELEGAVGGVGISDIKDFEEDTTNIVIEVEPSLHPPTTPTPPPTPQMTSDNEAPEEESRRRSPVRAQGSINGGFTGSSEEEGGSSGGSSREGESLARPARDGRKKKARKNNQVV